MGEREDLPNLTDFECPACGLIFSEMPREHPSSGQCPRCGTEAPGERVDAHA